MAENSRQIVGRLSLADKVRLLSGRDFWHTEELPEHGVQPAMLSDGPHGLRKQVAGDLELHQSEPATCFPPAATLAASWDVELLAEVGAAVGSEAVAAGVWVVLGPGLNIKRHPFCGRNFEYFSEDPLLAGQLAAAITGGIQSTGIGACLKHFAVNNQESHRLVVDAVVDERALREIYLAGFEIAVRTANPETVMAAYNKVNGHYACEHPQLLADILRGEWGFEGLVMSDWAATNDRVAGLRAGLDLEMPSSNGVFDSEVMAAVRAGDLAEAMVDQAAVRVLDLATRPRSEPEPADLDGHHDLARRAAADSSVLLHNDGVLPLSPDACVALIGAFAEQPRYQGAGSSRVNPTRLDTALAAFQARGSVRYAPGYDPVSAQVDQELIDDAVAAAHDAEIAVVLVGLPGSYESEGFDRTHLHLPEQHNLLVDAVASANPRTVVVLANGSPVAMPWADRVAAILETYLGGQAGGSALVDVLTGEAEPAGRLPESFPYSSADVPNARFFPGQARQVQYREGIFVGYRFYDSADTPVRFPFGHGLSYTRFAWDGFEANAERARVVVRNVGDRRGAEVVQIYVADLSGTVSRPEQELRGFAKVWLDPGESAEVVVPLDDRAFAYWDVVSQSWQVPDGEYEIRAGASSRDIRGRAQVTMQTGHVPAAEAFRGLVASTEDQFAARLGYDVPAPDPVRPFTRNTTIGELSATRLGQLFRAVVRRAAEPMLAQMAEGDDGMHERLVAALDEAPLRQLVLIGGGKPGWPLVDSLLDLLNRAPTAAGRRLLASLRR